MSRNGNGTYTPPASTWSPGVNGVTATTADFNALLTDVSAAITQSVSSDGQTPMTGNLALGNNRITGLANSVANTDAVPRGQVNSLLDQWVVFSGVPTYVSATSFTVPGDQTPTLQVGRRLKTVNTSGTVYSTITASVYSAPNTTVTVQNDSTVLDAGLSSVSYGLISSLESSLPPGRLLGVRRLSASGTYTPTPGAKSGLVIGTGGGGGGGSSGTTGAGSVSAGTGGASGSSFEHYFSSLPASQAFTIGAAGAPGSAGGTTTFGTLSAPGGPGGGGTVAAPPWLVVGPPDGGVATGGNLSNSQGQQGGQSQAVGVSLFVSGAGAPSRFGGGGRSLGATTSNGFPGLSPGSGGGGALTGASSPGQTGGIGGAGLILVYEYA